jgi:ribosomal protein S18 acetylase RimI-like enzyme
LQDNDVTIRPARPDDAAALASLMTSEIKWGRLSELGSAFIVLLHRHLIDSKLAHCPVAVLNDEVVGYVAWVSDRARFFREFVLRHGLTAARMLLPQIFRRSNLVVIFRSFAFFSKKRQSRPEPPAELVSFAVSSRHQGLGIAKELFAAVREEMHAREISELRVGTVAVDNTAANSMYQRLGFALIQTIPFYADTAVNVYVYSIF